MKIGVIGLGKLGLPSAACLADAGHIVYGYDSNIDYVKSLVRGECPIRETNLPGLLRGCSDNLIFETDLSEVINECDVFFIIVPTPSKRTKPAFDNSFVISAFTDMIPWLKNKKSFFVVNVVSTVMPGSCMNVFLPLLERELGKHGERYGLVYNPEFIALGSVISWFSNPDMILVGAGDPRSIDMIECAYRPMVGGDVPIEVMDWTSAEITKLSLNYYLTMKISYANMISLLADKFDVYPDTILRAIGKDSRVGEKLLRPGTAFGGPCFPRDVRALNSIFSFDYAYDFQNKVNMSILDSIIQMCRGEVAVLGMAYKPNTHVLDESASVWLMQSLTFNDNTSRWYDPKVSSSDIEEYAPISDGKLFNLQSFSNFCQEPYEACDGAETVVLMTPDDAWKLLDWEGISKRMSGEKVIVDPWMLLKDKYNWSKLGVTYKTWGTPL